MLSKTPVKQTWAGIGVVVFALMVLILGIYGVDLFTARMSFIFLLAGLIWTFFGWAMLKALRFPLLVLVLAIPFPAILFNQITFPLQLLASRIASDILPVLGVPTLHEGNVIELPVMKLEVAEACSGIRSLMSLFTLAVFYGYFLERTTKRRVLLALASIPIAVAANVVRIVGTGLCVQYWDPDKALGFFHEFSGWVMFVISLGLPLSGPPGHAAHLPRKGENYMKSPRFWVIIVLLTSTIFVLQSRGDVDRVPASEPLSRMPRASVAWTAQDIPLDRRHPGRCSAKAISSIASTAFQPPAAGSPSRYPHQPLYRLLRQSAHRPDHALPAELPAGCGLDL